MNDRAGEMKYILFHVLSKLDFDFLLILFGSTEKQFSLFNYRSNEQNDTRLYLLQVPAV